MKKKYLKIFLSLALIFSNLGIVQAEEIRLEDDFYEYVNKDWLEFAEIPEDRVSVGGFADLSEDMDKLLIHDFEEMKTKKKSAKGLKEFLNFYEMASNFEKRDVDAEKPAKKHIAKLEHINNLSQLNLELRELILNGYSLPFSFYVMSDMKNTSKNTLYISPPSSFLPEKSYYNTTKGNLLIDEFIKSKTKMLKLYGKTEDEALIMIEEALLFDKILIPYMKSAEEESSIANMYNPVELEIYKNYSNKINFPDILRSLVGKEPEEIIVTNTEYFEKFSRIVNEENFKFLKSWMLINTLSDYSGFLSEDFREANFIYSKALTGKQTLVERKKSAYYMSFSFYSEPIGIYYGNKYFGGNAKKDVNKITKKLIKTYKERIKNNDWLEEETKKKAILKLDKMKIHIAYPNKARDIYEKFIVDESSTLLDNAIIFSRISAENNFSKYAKTVNLNEWNISAATVNATYSPLSNTITFPAAILQYPFYDISQTESQNYGGIAAVIGHEISHAFDTNGAMFDEHGNLKNWWTEKDYKEFEKRTNYMLEEFNGNNVNGALTVSENVADLGGLSCALEITKQLKHYNLDEFFKSWATVWRNKTTKDYSELLLQIDVHAPPKLRSNVQLQNIDEFHEFYNIKPGDKMYKAPEKRIKIW